MEDQTVLFSLPLARLQPIFKNWIKEAISEMEQPEKFDPDERITRRDVCIMYKISYPTLHEEMKRGLPYEKVGRKTLFRRADVDRFFNAKRTVR